MGNDSIIAFRTREQLRNYLGIFSPQFRNRRWKMEFLGQMLFGIQASRDTLMSEIARSLQEDILAKKTQERLERHLAADGMDAKIHGLDFIVRLVGDRHLLNWGGKTEKSKVLAVDLARQCTLRCEDSVLFKSHNKVHNVRVKCGSMPVRLPDWPDADLHLVVVKWPGGEKPMMLLTTLNAMRTRKALWEVVQGCLARWRVEDTIRFIKQSYRLEHMRLLDCQRLKNMSALVVAVAYFAAAWLGKKVKLDALAKHVAKVSRRMFEVPEFFCYATADGLRWLFVWHGRWRGWKCQREECGDLQMEFELLSG